jgi:hypothetical protein
MSKVFIVSKMMILIEQSCQIFSKADTLCSHFYYVFHSLMASHTSDIFLFDCYHYSQLSQHTLNYLLLMGSFQSQYTSESHQVFTF